MIGIDEHGREVYPMWQAWILLTAPLLLGASTPPAAGALIALVIVGAAAGVVLAVTSEWPRR